ncbi:hypothetical protein FB45DRAFT_1037506 [Roridomyces roridus]|uniref:Uncharacterized protein n=1 Tax=Roridomyces roridus TaxID=1738132 RepID=A0AAD7B5F4_9AGAR|nr:hypothetical protein FB45DRAFT_1037506 [Roridomyces roridus]
MAFVTNTLGSVGKGVQNTLAPQQKQQAQEQESTAPVPPPTDGSESTPAEESQKPTSGGGLLSGISNAGTSVSNAAQTGLTSSLKTGTHRNHRNRRTSRWTAPSSLPMQPLSPKSGLDFGVGVVGGTADLAGTALGGIVNTAAETSGKVLEPVGSGLKAIEGFGELGAVQGMQKINGLLVSAVQQVGSWTMQGLMVLGLDEKTSKYAAYALHAVFSYPTGTAWVPTDTNLPITITNMSRTRWGRDWGQFSRMDWVEDVDINQFFASSDDTSWQEKFTKGRQYFGVLLLIFEWGTTWPFIMPDLPVEQIPFKDEIGSVVRTLILPTIFANLQRAREGRVDAGSEPPAKEAPKGPEDA